MSYEQLKRKNNFTEKPKGGWLHQEEAMAAGDEGLFYSFPMIYCGSIVITESLRNLNGDDQTIVTRELMKIVAEESTARPRTPPTRLSAKLQKFVNGRVTVGMIDAFLYISAKGLGIAPDGVGLDGFSKGSKTGGFIEFHLMKNISLAAGGEMRDYDLVSYVAKDDLGKRECYVFDCGENSDEVLATIGQAFVLAMDSKMKKKDVAKKSVEKLYARADSYLALKDPIYDEAGAGNEYRPGGASGPGATYDMVNDPQYDGIGPGSSMSNPMYDRAASMRKSRASYDDTTLVDSNYGDAPLLDKDKKGKKDKKEKEKKEKEKKDKKDKKGSKESMDSYLDVNPNAPGGRGSGGGGDTYLDVNPHGKGGAGGAGGGDMYLDVRPDAPGGRPAGGRAPPGMGGDMYLDVNPNRPGGGAAGGGDMYLDVRPDAPGGRPAGGARQPPGMGGDMYLDVNPNRPGGGAGGGDMYLDVRPDAPSGGGRPAPGRGAPAGGDMYLDVKPDRAGGGGGGDMYLDVKPDRPAAGGRGAPAGGDMYLDVKPDRAGGGGGGDMYLDVKPDRAGGAGAGGGDMYLAVNPDSANRVVMNEQYMAPPDEDPYGEIDEVHLRVVQGLNKLDAVRRKEVYEKLPDKGKASRHPAWVIVDDPTSLPKVSVEEVRQKMGKAKLG